MNTSDDNAATIPDPNIINSINQGFPSKLSLAESDICNFWEIWYQLGTEKGLVFMGGRNIIPKSLRGKVLCCLHSVHQSVDGMNACANNMVYWPGMNPSIFNLRGNYSICATFDPSQPREDSEWKYKPPRFLGQWQCCPSILQYKITPINSIGQSPAQLLSHHWLHNSILSQPILYKPHLEWVAVALCHKEILHLCNAKIVESYNRYTHNLSPLRAGDTVAVQSPLNCTPEKIITVLSDRQYWIRVDGSGSITLRHCRFFRKCKIKATPTPIPNATPLSITSTSNAPLLHPNPPTSSNNDTHAAIEPPPKKLRIHHHTFRHWKFLELCPGYYHITGLASKKGIALIQSCPHAACRGRCKCHWRIDNNNSNTYLLSNPN